MAVFLPVSPAVDAFLRIMVFLLGASIGSFLNVVIYRVPLGMSVGNPKRSFCPSCRKPIPWYRNVPILSWISLRGKCASCGARISPRYLIVEFLTGLLFLLVWLWFPLLLVFPYWVLVCLFVCTVFIDFDHFIIPDSITLGGTVAGLALAAAFPAMMGAATWWNGLLWSAVGAATGFALLWTIVELGKLAFGKLKLEPDSPQPFVICQDPKEDEPTLTVGDGKDGEKHFWSELFYRKNDRLLLSAQEISFDGDPAGPADVTVTGAGFKIASPNAETPGRFIALEDLQEVRGTFTRIVIPREAMGFGDVKFMAMAGAFLGWQAVLFTLLAASVAGTAVALPARLLGRQEWAAKIPFGPYLVAGAVVWMFSGRRIVEWYFSLAG